MLTTTVYMLTTSSLLSLIKSIKSNYLPFLQISKYNLMDRLMRYTALSPRSMQVELQEAYTIYTESLRTWRVCILYGLGCDAVRWVSCSECTFSPHCSDHLGQTFPYCCAYSGFCSMKYLRALLLPLDGIGTCSVCEVAWTVCWHPVLLLGGERSALWELIIDSHNFCWCNIGPLRCGPLDL